MQRFPTAAALGDCFVRLGELQQHNAQLTELRRCRAAEQRTC